jgi:hypothetical protein
VRWAWNRAARIACAADMPVNMSTAATPNFSGGRPASPLIDISPLSPWITRS